MDLMKWIIVGVVIVAAITVAILFLRKRQKTVIGGFEQIEQMLKSVPKQKKQPFILFVFKESARAGKKKNVNFQSKLNDHKYVDVQLLQLGMVLKDRTKAQDKNTKAALKMYDAYMTWEKAKTAKKNGAA